MAVKVKNRPFWIAQNDPPRQYPWLGSDELCDVCIIGGGITGAMAAYRFASEGIDTVLVTSEPVGFGATSSAVPYATFDMGLKLTELTQKIGIQSAVDVFSAGVQALDCLEELADELEEDIGFERRDSLIFTDNPQDAEQLNQEYLVRRHNGFDVDYVSKETARSLFSFNIEGAIISKQLAVNFDPYRLTHALLKRAAEKGARIYENTEIAGIENNPNESILHSVTGRTITAESIIMAVGHEARDFLKSAVQTKTSFAIVTSPVGDFSSWPGRCIISTWSRPNITFSTTPDDRIFVSGLDTSMLSKDGMMFGRIPAGRITKGKFRDLQTAMEDMFPMITDAYTEFEFISQYVDTADGLPIVGEEQGYFGCSFAVCPGSNSILFSEMAGRILSEAYDAEECADYKMFSSYRFK